MTKSTKKKAVTPPPVDNTYPPASPEILAQMAATLYGKNGAETPADAVEMAFRIAVETRELLENEQVVKWHEMTRADQRSAKERAAHALLTKYGFESLEFKEPTPWSEVAERLFKNDNASENLTNLFSEFHKEDTIQLLQSRGLYFHDLNLALNLKKKEDDHIRGQKLTSQRLGKQAATKATKKAAQKIPKQPAK